MAEARIAELETQVAALTADNAALKERLAKRGHHDIDKLNAYNAAHPEKAAARSKKYKEAHREEYNARRRELYRLKRAAQQETTAVAAPS